MTQASDGPPRVSKKVLMWTLSPWSLTWLRPAMCHPGLTTLPDFTRSKHQTRSSLRAAPVGLHKSELRIQEWDWDLSSFAPQQDTTSPGNSSLRGWTINISVEKSSAVKLAMSSKASGRKKLENRLVTGNWKKIDREGVPWESSEKSGSRDWRKGWGCWTILMGRKSRPTL